MKKRHLLRYGVLLLCIAASGILLMQVSQRVQRAEDEQAVAQRALAQEKRRIDILEAEWAYLNSPQRLEILAETLGMQRPGAKDLLRDMGDVPISAEPTPSSSVFMNAQPVSYGDNDNGGAP